MKKWIWAAGFAAIFFSILLMPATAHAAIVPEGFSVGGQDLGGLEEEEAKQKIQEYVSSMSGQTLQQKIWDFTGKMQVW